MVNFKIVIPGECAVKKNTVGQMWYRTITTKEGLIKTIPLSVPVKYYKKPYVEWAKKAVEVLSIFKSNLALHDNIYKGNKLIFPITEPVVVTYIFFLKHERKIDLSNLIEAPQDILSGNAGNFLDKKRKGETIKFDHSKYQILSDDNRWIIKNLGASTIMTDKVSPRTEIFITSFNLKIWAEVMKLLHPGLTIGTNELKEQPTFNFNKTDDIFGGLFDE